MNPDTIFRRQSRIARGLTALLLLAVSCAASATRYQMDFHLENIALTRTPASSEVPPGTGTLHIRFNAGAHTFTASSPVQSVVFEGLIQFVSSTTSLIPWNPPLPFENQDPRDLLAFSNVPSEDFSYVDWLLQYRHNDGVNDFLYLISLDTNASGTHVPALADAASFDESALIDYLFAVQARHDPLLFKEAGFVFDGVNGELKRFDGIEAQAFIDAITVVPLPSMLLPSLVSLAGLAHWRRRQG